MQFKNRGLGKANVAITFMEHVPELCHWNPQSGEFDCPALCFNFQHCIKKLICFLCSSFSLIQWKGNMKGKDFFLVFFRGGR